MCSMTLPFEFELSVDHNELSIHYDTKLTAVLSVKDTLGQWINTQTAEFFFHLSISPLTCVNR